ncbi:hypothetical protein BGW80DRAFT_1351398, partial [Lactifluus volemus]
TQPRPKSSAIQSQTSSLHIPPLRSRYVGSRAQLASDSRNRDRSGGGYNRPGPHHNSSGLPRPPPISFRPTSRLYAGHCQLRLANLLHSHRITHGTRLHSVG